MRGKYKAKPGDEVLVHLEVVRVVEEKEGLIVYHVKPILKEFNIVYLELTAKDISENITENMEGLYEEHKDELTKEA